MKETLGFQKPLRGDKRKKVKVAVIRDHQDYIQCSCTWCYVSPRKKVREDRAQRHVDRKHGGAAIWL